MDQLTSALAAAQKVEKKFRQLHNHGEVSDAQLNLARRIVSDYRDLCSAFGAKVVDIDSKAERNQRRKEY